MYPSFPLSGSIASYHPQPALNLLQSKSSPQEDLVSLRCPRYSFQFMTSLFEVFSDSHLQDMALICCNGPFVRTNKLLLAACSPYFRQVLAIQGSELYLPGITAEVLNVLLVFMISGDVHVSHRLLPYVMHAATTLQIKGFQDACNMIPNILTEEAKHQEVVNIKPEVDQPSKKRKLEIDDNISESGSASLFRPWNVSVASAKNSIPHIVKPNAFNVLAQSSYDNDTTSFTVPLSSMFAKPSMSRNVTSTPIVPQSYMNHSSCISPNTSIDFAPLLASTMKNLVPPRSFAVPVSSPQTTNLPVNITPTSPISWSPTFGHTTDISAPLASALERIGGKAHSSEKLKSKTSPMSRLKSNDYSKPGSLDHFTTPVSKKSYPIPLSRTPLELVKADPSSAAEVLCGSLPLFDDSKDETVVEYRDESDNEGNLVIDLEDEIE